MNSKVKWICRTAVMLAMLIVLQAVTKAMGQFVTGSCVNFVLATTVLVCGLSSGLTVALLSPFFAVILGIAATKIPLIPGICLGNVVLVLCLWFLLGRVYPAKGKNVPEGVDVSLTGSATPGPTRKIVAIAVAAVAKFVVLFVVITKLILPLMSLKDAQVQAITASFSWPQLVTAAIGCTLAVLLWPRLKKAVRI